MSVNLGVLVSHKFHIWRPILSFFFVFFFHLVEVTGEGWSSTSLIRNVSARLRSSNHMLPTDFSQSRAHPRVTYRRIFPLLLLLSAATALLEKGIVRFYPCAAVSIFRILDMKNSNKILQISRCVEMMGHPISEMRNTWNLQIGLLSLR